MWRLLNFLTVFVFMLFLFVTSAVISLYLVHLINVQCAHGQRYKEKAQPFVIEEVAACHAGNQADDNYDKHINLVSHQ